MTAIFLPPAYPSRIAFRAVWALVIGMQLFLPVAEAQSDAVPEEITLEAIWSGRYFAKGVQGFTALKDPGSYAAFDPESNGQRIQRYSFKDGKPKEVLFDAEAFSGIDAPEDFSFSPDEEGILLLTDVQPIYRHSFTAQTWIYHRPDKSVHRLDADPVRNAVFSPREDKIAFCKNNNIYIKDLRNDQIHALSQDGLENSIIHGTPDWVYEEEFSYDRAYEWSNDGGYLAWVRFDESGVPEFSMDVYGKGLYPTPEVFKYPKAGEPNSKVSLHLAETGTYSVKTVDLSAYDFEYLPRLYWTPNGELWVLLLNRLQNRMELVGIDPKSGQSRSVLVWTDPAYLELPEDLMFLPDGRFATTAQVDGYNRVVVYSAEGQRLSVLGSEWGEVDAVYGLDPKGEKMYYQVAGTDIHRRILIETAIKTGKSRVLSTTEGWNRAVFNSDFSLMQKVWERTDAPPVTSLWDVRKLKQLRVLEDNAELKSRLGALSLSTPEFLEIQGAQGPLKAYRILPPNFDPSKKYPVLMHVYGGPGHQTVTDRYDAANGMWHQMLARKGYIVVSVDNRGTGFRGRDFRKSTYGQLGKLETEDQMAAANALGALPYVDASRIGIWGWSYGGYMSSLCITQGADVFKAAIAVAPVTNWRFYDNIYTERYMGLPLNNASGYDDNSPVSHASKLKGAYFLVHGTADDNVHVQNAMRMAEALIQADKDFDYMLYPDKNHGIYGGKTRLHLYRRMTEFVLEKL
ncbi:prolyl oligopeptidase family serine peptidase [bacterium]|nr:prolyl oligopeptidase family serine peptidase [bacterium]